MHSHTGDRVRRIVADFHFGKDPEKLIKRSVKFSFWKGSRKTDKKVSSSVITYLLLVPSNKFTGEGGGGGGGGVVTLTEKSWAWNGNQRLEGM